jgi:hypothetical protein
MDVFISWSGEKSGVVAKVIGKYLPALINDAAPWLSSKDISVGARWSKEITSKLETAQIGVTCLTSENQHEPWILFEAGAVAKLTDVGRAMVLRIDLSTTEVTGPLSQFQSVGLDEEGVFSLVSSVNAAGSKPVAEETLKLTFQALWPKMKEQFSKLPLGAAKATPTRSEKDMLEEILGLMRDQTRITSRPDELMKMLATIYDKRHYEDEQQRLEAHMLFEKVKMLTLDRDRSLLGILQRRLGGIIPSLDEIKTKVCEELVANRLHSASDALLDAKWSRIDGDVLVETELSKTMLPVVINPTAEAISIRAMEELGEMSKLRFSYAVMPIGQKPARGPGANA